MKLARPSPTPTSLLTSSDLPRTYEHHCSFESLKTMRMLLLKHFWETGFPIIRQANEEFSQRVMGISLHCDDTSCVTQSTTKSSRIWFAACWTYWISCFFCSSRTTDFPLLFPYNSAFLFQTNGSATCDWWGQSASNELASCFTEQPLKRLVKTTSGSASFLSYVCFHRPDGINSLF